MHSPQFSHRPLARDHPSIRLIQVQPILSPDGLIQCTISHHIIDAPLAYSCLSYRWGEPEPAQAILLNGLAFSVRQNLYDFLSVTQRRMVGNTAEPAAYWIDALCIDQSNVFERNHQVEQMGRIFSSAGSVHVWLGAMPLVKDVVPILRKAIEASLEEWKTVGEMKNYLAEHIAQNAYWTRAWITQEVLLAKEALVVLDTEMLPLNALLNGLQCFYVPLDGPLLNSGFFGKIKGDFVLRSPFEFYTLNLVALAMHFSRRKCSIPRDHFYSLFSLCKADQAITVDYESTACDLAYQILRHGTARPCLCSARFVLQMLRVGDELQPDVQQSAVGPFLQFECTRLVVGCGHDASEHKLQSTSTNVTQTCEQPSVVFWDQPNANGFPAPQAGFIDLTWARDACEGAFWTRWRGRHCFSATSTLLRRLGTRNVKFFVPGSGPRNEKLKMNGMDDVIMWTEYLRGDGFSAKYSEKEDTYTFRVALWALATWMDHSGHKGVDLCKRVDTPEKRTVDADGRVVRHLDSDLNMQMGHGPWDLEADG